ncbi:MAG: hypothetical protein ACKVTZ_15920 [Bacteroidia bacterium]
MAEEKLTSEGKCLYCNQLLNKRSIGKHLDKHLNELPKVEGAKAFHVRVEFDVFFLELLVAGDCTLKKIDGFLRQIWLECCGHLSAFSDKKTRNEVPMTKKASAILFKGLVLEYEYDFGSTTLLTLKVTEEFALKPKESITLLSRNEPLAIMCSTCGKEPAVEMCMICMYEEQAVYCKKCSKKHQKTCADAADYALMRVVNSPRMGVCGYAGGSIDKERDGVYVLPK